MCHHVRGNLSHAVCVCCTGEGGNDLLGNKKQIGNQELQRGNAALVSPLTRKLLSPMFCRTDTSMPIHVHSAAQVSMLCCREQCRRLCASGIRYLDDGLSAR